MSTKAFVKMFEGFRGLSYRASNLTRPPEYAVDAKNVRIGKPYNISGEPGFKIKAQPKPMYGVHNYVYQDTTGVVREELLGVNEILWKLSETYLYITHVAAPTAGSYSILVNETTNVFEFILKEGSTTVLTQSLGTGVGGSDITLQALATAINAASTKFIATVLYTGVANGLQVAAGTLGNPLAIAASGDLNNRRGEWVELTPSASGPGVYRYITYDTGNNIGWNVGAGINVTNGQVLGHGLYPAAILPITTSTAMSTALGAEAAKIYYNYWQPVSYPDAASPIFTNFNRVKAGTAVTTPLSAISTFVTPSQVPNASFANAENVCFIAAGGLQQVCKYDGNSVYKAGMPYGGSDFATNAPTVAVGAATGLTGTYYYKVAFAQKDNRGRYVEGHISKTSAALTLANQKGSITIPSINLGSTLDISYNDNCAKVNGAQAAVTTITVFNTHTMRVGDTAYFLNTLGTTSYVERLITAVSDTTITIAGSTVTVAANDIISANLRVNLYRTIAGGTSEFYLVKELPHDAIGGAFTYTDTVVDASLGAQYIEPDIETKLPYPPPYAKYLTVHGTALFAAEGLTQENHWGYKDPDIPLQGSAVNTIAWSDSVLGLEAFPLVNQDRVSGASKSAITGIASDVDDILLVFKEDAVHTVVGEPDINIYSINEVARGSVGVSSHNSIKKVSVTNPNGDVLKFTVGLGKHGVCFVYGGKVIESLTKELKGKFFKIQNSSSKADYVPRLAEAAFNPVTYQYQVSLPRATGGTALTVNGSDLFSFDTEEGVWLRQNYDDTLLLNSVTPMNYLGGMTSYSDNIYWVTHYSGSIDTALSGVLFAKHTAALGKYAFAANTLPITQDLVPQWDYAGEPSVEKEWQQYKAFSYQDSADFIPFDLRVRTYRNWEDYTSATASSDYTMNFTTVDQVELFFDLLQGTSARTMLFRFTTSTIHQRMFLSGYEYTVALSMQKGQLEV